MEILFLIAALALTATVLFLCDLAVKKVRGLETQELYYEDFWENRDRETP
jgi:hypothetical protein